MSFEINVKHLHILIKEKTLTDIQTNNSTPNSMKHSADNGVFQTNLLQALQKNKVIQGQLTESQRTHYIQLLKDMQVYNLKEKYNRELLYTWKKESYVRQLKKNLQDYEQKRFGVRDAYYEYQVRNLGNIMAGQQGVVIPPSEEERRLNINEKYHQFLQKNPLRATTSSSMRVAKSAIIPTDKSKEETDAHGLETTWKQIHAQSAVGSKRKQNNTLPSIHRSSTMDDIRRNKALAKSLVPPMIAIVSSVLVTTTPELAKPSSNDNIQQSPRSPNQLGLPDGIEPLHITSETLEKHTRADLVSMRSVRRPRKNPAELNLLFETRKRIYQINKRALDYQLCQRKCALQQNTHFDRPKQIDSINTEENLLVDINESTRKHQPDKIII